MVLNFQLRKCFYSPFGWSRQTRIWIWKQNKSKRSRSAPAISAYLSLPGLSRAPMPTEMYLVGSFNSFYIWFFWPKSSIHRSRGQLPANKECLTSKNHELLKRVLQALIHNTLRPSGTLLFSGLPMMIWQKNQRKSPEAVVSSNHKVQFLIFVI